MSLLTGSFWIKNIFLNIVALVVSYILIRTVVCASYSFIAQYFRLILLSNEVSQQTVDIFQYEQFDKT
jgi:hypothetical protein